MQAKSTIVDASSAIILDKAGLLHLLVRTYRVVLAGSVYQEITVKSDSCAEECKRLVQEKKVNVCDQPLVNYSTSQGLDRGEAETIELFKTGVGDFIITDDGSAAKYCKKEGLPFINALLFPVILKHAEVSPSAFCNRAFEDVMGIGRYSDKIITFAHNCQEQDIAFALP